MKIKFNFGKKKAEPAKYYWEWYNRTRVITDRIKALRIENIRVLDVGGTKRYNLLKKMGIPNVLSANIIDDTDIRASGHKLPFKDGSFECVTCVAMLEHVPRDLRVKIVEELIRVASRAVFISAPIDSEENTRSEEMVLKYLSASFVKEHRVFGLVDFGALVSSIKSSQAADRIKRMEGEDIDNLMNWVLMMIGDKVEISQLYQDLYFLENRYHPRTKVISLYLK